MSDDTNSGFDASNPSQATAAVENAAPSEVDAHRGLLGGVVEELSSRGIDVDALAQRAGLPSADIGDMSAGQLAQFTQQLATQHFQVVQEVAQQFPEAQGLLGMLTGGQSSGSGGGVLGGFLGRMGLE